MQRLRLSLFFVLFALSGCTQQTILATMDAAVRAAGDTTGANSARARINFTQFSQPAGANGNDTKLRLHFSNPEGDTLDFEIAPAGNTPGNFPTGTYTLDGTDNTFASSFTVVSSGQPNTISVTTTNGFVNLLNITIDSQGILRKVGGEYQANFDIGGTGVGVFEVTLQ